MNTHTSCGCVSKYALRRTQTSNFPSRVCGYVCVVQVGDYVLSPDIVVERKALPDLFASLGSGRLYNQVRPHCRSRRQHRLY